MGHYSTQHLLMQEEAAYMESDNIATGHALSMNEMHELFHSLPVMAPSFISYMEKHALLLDQRNMYADMSSYARKVHAVSLNHKSFWWTAYERNLNALQFIENKLLEVESDLS